jgi:hypothetical protein
MIKDEEVTRPVSRWQVLCVFALSVGFAIAATQLLASLADAMGWCCVHSWAMLHGSFAVVFLLFGLVGYEVVRVVGRRLRLITPAAPSSWLPYVAYVSAALGTLMETGAFMWVGVVAGGRAVVQRIRGRAVRPFGLAVIGLIVGLLSLCLWIYSWWVVLSVG